MEGIIVLLVMFYFWSVIVKAIKGGKNVKQGQQARQAQQQQKEKATRQAAMENARYRFPRQDAQGSLSDDHDDEGASAYAPLQVHMGELAREESGDHSYVGSLGGGSHEGEDICDPALGHTTTVMTHRFQPQIIDERDSAGAERPNLQWNANAIVQGVIMSEVLKRPNERKWGIR